MSRAGSPSAHRGRSRRARRSSARSPSERQGAVFGIEVDGRLPIAWLERMHDASRSPRGARSRASRRDGIRALWEGMPMISKKSGVAVDLRRSRDPDRKCRIRPRTARSAGTPRSGAARSRAVAHRSAEHLRTPAASASSSSAPAAPGLLRVRERGESTSRRAVGTCRRVTSVAPRIAARQAMTTTGRSRTSPRDRASAAARQGGACGQGPRRRGRGRRQHGGDQFGANRPTAHASFQDTAGRTPSVSYRPGSGRLEL